MGMWYNYTFARNDAANARCCPQGNSTNTGDWSFCTVEVGNGSDVHHSVSTLVNKCLVWDQNVSDIRQYLQDNPEHAPKSSATQAAPKSFGVLAFVLLALSLASLTLAQDQATLSAPSPVHTNSTEKKTDQNQELNVYLEYEDLWKSQWSIKYGRAGWFPMCTHFEPDDPSTWNLDADLPPIAVAGTGVGVPSSGAIAPGPEDGLYWYLNVTWRADVPVTGNWTALEERMRSVIPTERMDRLRKEVYVPYVGDMFSSPGLPRSNIGQPAVSSSAVFIPGTFSDCVNVTEPTHKGNVSVPYWDRLFFFTHLEPM